MLENTYCCLFFVVVLVLVLLVNFDGLFPGNNLNQGWICSRELICEVLRGVKVKLSISRLKRGVLTKEKKRGSRLFFFMISLGPHFLPPSLWKTSRLCLECSEVTFHRRSTSSWGLIAFTACVNVHERTVSSGPPTLADDSVHKHVAKLQRVEMGEEAGGKHAFVRRVDLNGKVLRGREMRRCGDGAVFVERVC